MKKWGRFPRNWSKSKGVLLFKKGDPNSIQNWRPICLTSCAYRIITAHIANAVQELNSRAPFITQAQKGFIQSTRGCIEHTLKVQELLCHAQRTDQDLYFLTIDFRDAFGSVPHKAIWKAMKELGFEENIIHSLKESYTDTSVTFNDARVFTNKGVKQGCPLSPLLFNLVLEKLLRKLQESATGITYVTRSEGEETTHHTNVQAYADDIILIANNREDLDSLCETLTEFTADLKLSLAPHKCSLYSYIKVGHRRMFTNTPVTLQGQEVPTIGILSLSEYLGTPVTRSHVLRMRHNLDDVKTIEDKLQALSKAGLRLNQVLDTIRKFIVPMLDYTMQCNPHTQDSLDQINLAIRKCVNKIAHAEHGTPVPFFHTDWKDGGLSIPELKERQDTLLLSSFIHTTFFSSEKKFFRQMFKDEMAFRRTPREPTGFCGYLEHNGSFSAQTERGTKTLAVKAVKAAHRLQVRVSKQDTVVKMAKGGEEKVIANTKDLLQFLKTFTRPKWHEKLAAQAFKGHSFTALKENPQSNFFFSPRHPQVNDNVLKFIYKARTNNLPTGEVLSHGKGEVPRCQRCANASDTLMHRLNGCRPLYSKYKVRHNKVEAIIVETIKSTTHQRLQIHRSTRVTMPGCPDLSPENRVLLPDIWYFDRVNNHLKIIEITVPYDSIDDTGSTKLSQRRQEKLEKYAGLVDEIRREWNVATHFHVIVVSSLGTVPKETVRELRQIGRAHV